MVGYHRGLLHKENPPSGKRGTQNTFHKHFIGQLRIFMKSIAATSLTDKAHKN